ncbi:MAG: PASTA domain-containing protein [Bacteroidota bacterium]
MNFLKILISKEFLKNLLIIVIIGVVLIAGAFIWLKIYTKHGQTITVPDLSGLTSEEVEIITRSKSIRFEVVDSIFDQDLPRGTVAKQNPRPGSKVKENRRLYLTMNAVNPEKVSMPDVTGVSLRQARAVLETYGLTLGKISYKPDIAVNVVLEQQNNDSAILPGTIVEKNSEIDLVLGQGLSNETTLVPNLVGFDHELAKEFLADRYLNVGALIYDNTFENKEDTAQAFIWKQRPPFEEKNQLKLGENVDIWLTTDTTKLPVADTLINDDEIEIYEEFMDE